MTTTTLIGVGGHSILLMALTLRIGLSLKLRGSHSYIVAATVFILTLIPFTQLPVAQFSRGLFGDFSFTTIVVLVRYLLFPNASITESKQLFATTCLIGALFYPAALGLSMVDPYQWGYLSSLNGIETPMIFLAGVSLILLIALSISNSTIMLCIVVALGGFMLEAIESRNLWDYLIDPMIFTYSLIYIGIYFVKMTLVNHSARKYNHT